VSKRLLNIDNIRPMLPGVGTKGNAHGVDAETVSVNGNADLFGVVQDNIGVDGGLNSQSNSLDRLYRF